MNTQGCNESQLDHKNLWEQPLPEFPQQIYLGIRDGYCNLKCPACFIHSPDNQNEMIGLRGTMALDDVARIMDEVRDAKSFINPYRFSEPLLKNTILPLKSVTIKDSLIFSTISSKNLRVVLLNPRIIFSQSNPIHVLL